MNDPKVIQKPNEFEAGSTANNDPSSNFIRTIIAKDKDSGTGKIIMRFPPEPNGYLHIGHAKSICLNFGLALELSGRCSLRFDDTNPLGEEIEFIDSIKEDIRWLGFDWGDHELFTSDYFDILYEWAEYLVENGNAYVDELSADELREYRGTLNNPGTNSPYRDRPTNENLNLLRRMKAGEFDEGSRVLRAKIDMASGNMNLRDPVLYRIIKSFHPRTGDKWFIYPTYDFAHGQSDAIEGVTHSLCTMEFEDHRPLYDWLLKHLPVPCVPRQIEFARLNLTYTILSKRNLSRLVEEERVSGWSDPRMPTLAGLRRKGVPPVVIRDFCARIGISKANSTVDISMFEACIREFLNKHAIRRMAVLRPLKVLIENFPEGKSVSLSAINNPEDAGAGTRTLLFSKEIYIERDDFMEDPPKKFFRLSPGREVRLRYAYILKCVDVIKDASGEIIELRCLYDPETKGGKTPDGRKVKSTLHWVSKEHAIEAEVRLYENLFVSKEPGKESEIMEDLNPTSLEVVSGCKLEPALSKAELYQAVQFERLGYFSLDPEKTNGQPVFNRTVSLRDEWAKVKKRAERL